MKLYKSCNTLPIRFFFRTLETKDFRNLVVGFDVENDSLVLTDSQNEEFGEIFNEILNEYSVLTDNHNIRADYRKQILIVEWETEYAIVTESLKLYAQFEDNIFLGFIRKIGHEIDETKDINKQIEVLLKKMKGLKNKINIQKIKLEEKEKRTETKVKMDLDKDALYLERNLELKRSIDPDVTTVTQWLKLIEMNKEKNEEYVKFQNRNSKRSK